MDRRLAPYLSGNRLYGDNFSLDEIMQWFADEASDYDETGSSGHHSPTYPCHRLNHLHHFRYIKGQSFEQALGIGQAQAEAYKPLKGQVDQVTILDSDPSLCEVEQVHDIPCSYIAPRLSGTLDFSRGTFDLITCFDALQHIPNVSYQIRECYRCLKPGGIMLLREPIISMGDWSQPRKGVSRRQRGIPLRLMDVIVTQTGFKVISSSLCCFPAIPIVAKSFQVLPFNWRLPTRLDALLSMIFSWNVTYHRTSLLRKIAPKSVAYVLQK